MDNLEQISLDIQRAQAHRYRATRGAEPTPDSTTLGGMVPGGGAEASRGRVGSSGGAVGVGGAARRDGRERGGDERARRASGPRSRARGACRVDHEVTRTEITTVGVVPGGLSRPSHSSATGRALPPQQLTKVVAASRRASRQSGSRRRLPSSRARRRRSAKRQSRTPSRRPSGTCGLRAAGRRARPRRPDRRRDSSKSGCPQCRVMLSVSRVCVAAHHKRSFYF